MSTVQHISVSADSDAPVPVLWDVIADAPRYLEPSGLDYELLSGMPFKGRTSRISVLERPGGRSRLEWKASFDLKILLLPGGLIASGCRTRSATSRGTRRRRPTVPPERPGRAE